jgi:hypothetical protein
MSVIEATSGTYRSRVDGTIVLSVEIDPRFAAQALSLFGMHGTPIAIAALKAGYGAAGGELKSEPEKEKIGALCKLAVQWCNDLDFQNWAGVLEEEDAKQFILATCGCDSRKDLDKEISLAMKFNSLIRQPYMAYLKANP